MSILTSNELSLISESWKLVVPDLEHHGLSFFLKLFEEYPTYQEKFFPELHQDERKIQRHGAIVLKSVGKLVAFLEANKVIALVDAIKRLATNHSRRGVLREQFYPACRILLEYLAQALGTHLSTEGALAWKRFLGTFVELMQEGYAQLDASK
uniref:Non-symbiotic hemoglobin 1 n=1 Tax=Caligus clemensi TaxID=344056 RepID=C1C1M6_CALCM|nr:Non-symbiotic hemoglobin 1 [Caligus clemensi]